jgi:hypothetical protein
LHVFHCEFVGTNVKVSEWIEANNLFGYLKLFLYNFLTPVTTKFQVTFMLLALRMHEFN